MSNQRAKEVRPGGAIEAPPADHASSSAFQGRAENTRSKYAGKERAGKDLVTGTRKLRQAESTFLSGHLDAALTRIDELIGSDDVETLTERQLMRRCRALRQRIEKARRLRSNQYTLFGLIAVSTVFVTLAAALPVPSVVVEGTIRTTDLVFQPCAPLSLAGVQATGADLAGLDSFATSGFLLQLQPDGTWSKRPEPTNLALKPLPGASSFAATVDDSQLSLEELAMPQARGQATFSTLQQPIKQLTVGLPSASRGEIQLGKRARLLAEDATLGGQSSSVDLTFEPDQSVTFSGGDGAHLVLRSPAAKLEKQTLLDHVTVSKLQLLNPGDEKRSPVIGGTLRLRDLSLEPIELAPGDVVALATSEELVIRELTWDSALTLRVAGRVVELEVNGRSRKPSLLQWSRAHNLLLLVSGALVSVVSFLWLAFQRLEIIRS